MIRVLLTKLDDLHLDHRLHSHLDDIPPAEFEAAYDAISTGTPLVGITA